MISHHVCIDTLFFVFFGELVKRALVFVKQLRSDAARHPLIDTTLNREILRNK